MKHIVGFSGGIDSQAVALLVRQRENPAEEILGVGWGRKQTMQSRRRFRRRLRRARPGKE